MTAICIDEQSATRHRQNQIRSELLLRSLVRNHPHALPDYNMKVPTGWVAVERPAPVEEPSPEFKELWGDPPVIEFAAAWAAFDKLPCHNKVRRIQKLVADDFKVSMVDLTSTRRTADIVLPRQVAMYVAKTETSNSLPEIGRRFGGRDHTTVLHSVRRVEALMKSDPALEVRVTAIAKRFEQTEVAS